MTNEELHWLKEYLRTLKNQAQIALILVEQDELGLLPTELECAYQTAQTLIDDYCIK